MEMFSLRANSWKGIHVPDDHETDESSLVDLVSLFKFIYKSKTGMPNHSCLNSDITKKSKKSLSRYDNKK